MLAALLILLAMAYASVSLEKGQGRHNDVLLSEPVYIFSERGYPYQEEEEK